MSNTKVAQKNFSALNGTTEAFEGNGRKFGYPTANITVDTDLKDGVYFGFADLESYKDHPTLIFIGTPTTVGATARRVEAHLLDIADKDYHGKPLQVTLHHFYRSNQHFESIEALLVVMKADEVAFREWLKLQGEA